MSKSMKDGLRGWKLKRSLLADQIDKRAHQLAKKTGRDPIDCIFDATDEIAKEGSKDNKCC